MSMMDESWSEFKKAVFSSGFGPIEIGDVEEEGMLVVECLTSMINGRWSDICWVVVHGFGAH